MDVLTKRKKFTWWACMLFAITLMAVVLYILSKKFVFIFTANDDLFMRAIITGDITGTPDGHAIFMLYPLTKVLSLLYKSFPIGDWYGVFILGMQSTCWGLLLYRAIWLGSTKYKQLIFGLGMLTFLLMVDLKNIVQLQFTTLAGMIAFTALFWFVTKQKKEKLYTYAPEIVLLSISFMIRYDVVLMYLPFFALFGAIQVAYSYKKDKNKDSIKKHIRTYVLLSIILVVIFGGLYGIHSIAYDSKEWKEYKEFNVTRSNIYDYYSIPPYEEYMYFYKGIGIQEEDIPIINSINLSFNERINLETLNKILAKSIEIKKISEKTINVPKATILSYIDTLPSSNWYVLFLYFLYGVTLTIVLIKREHVLKWLLGSLLILRSVLWIYLVYKGRMIERATYPLILAEIAILIGCIYLSTSLKEAKTAVENVIVETAPEKIAYVRTTVRKGIKMALLIFLCGYLWASPFQSSEKYNADILNSTMWAPTLFSYIEDHPENYYLLDTMSVSMIKAPLFGKDTVIPENAILIGGWLSKVPIADKIRQEKLGDTIENAFVLNDNVLLIQTSNLATDWIANYLNSKYENLNASDEVVRTIDYNGVSAYCIIHVVKNRVE